MKRVLTAAIVALTFVVPTGARADSATYSKPYAMGAKGGDTANFIQADPATGEITVLRLGGTAVSGSLGCLAQGGYANFLVSHTVVSGVDKVTVNMSDVFLDNFTWLVASVSIVGGDGYLASTKMRGPLFGDVSFDVPAVSSSGQRALPGDTLQVRFGLETASSCPSVDGGHAVFTSIVVA